MSHLLLLLHPFGHQKNCSLRNQRACLRCGKSISRTKGDASSLPPTSAMKKEPSCRLYWKWWTPPFSFPIPAPTQPPIRLHLSGNRVPLSMMLSQRSDRCLLICLNEKNQSEEPAQLLLSSGFAHERWVWLTDASRFTVYWFLQKSQICQFRQGSDTKLSI